MIDARGTLVGIVTIDDVLDVAEEEATREIQRFGGSKRSTSRTLSYAAAGSMVRKRASWLVVLFLGEMLTATAMGHFEEEIAKASVLALFVPLIISSGGNSGSQAATLIIRALALGELKLTDCRQGMRRELASGLMLGSLLGTIGFCRIASGAILADAWYPSTGLLVGLTVGLSLVGRRALGHALRAPCCRSCSSASDSTRRPPRPRSWPRSWM